MFTRENRSLEKHIQYGHEFQMGTTILTLKQNVEINSIGYLFLSCYEWDFYYSSDVHSLHVFFPVVLVRDKSSVTVT